MPLPRNEYWFAGVLAACVIALAFDLDGYPLLDPDEGRNAEIAREMAASGDFVLPRLNGLPYVDKPVLYFAVGAAAMRLLGPTVLAARLPSLAFMLATIAVVGWFGYRLFGRDAAWIAAIATAATPFGLAYARTVIFDSALTFFVVVAMLAFYLAVESQQATRTRQEPTDLTGWWTSLAWAAMACGVLTKGPIALILPLLVALPFAAWHRAWRALADPVAILFFIAVVLPWILLVQRHVPDLLQYALITESAARMFTDQLQRNEPFWYFLPLLPAAALPWSVVAAGGLHHVGVHQKRGARPDGRFVFLLLWLLLPLAFFSLSHSKRPQYLLPLIPAIGLIVGAAWSLHPRRLPGRRIGAVTVGLFAVFLLAGHQLIPKIVSATPAIAAAIPGTARGLGIACVLGCVMTWLARGRRPLALAGLALPVLAIPFTSRRMMDEIGRERSSFEIAVALEPHVTAATEVVAVSVYPLSLPFYLRRSLVLSTADGTELTSNYLSSRFDAWVNRTATLKPADWWREALVTCDRPRVFVFESANWQARQFVDVQLALLADNGRFAVYGPCGMTNLATDGR